MPPLREVAGLREADEEEDEEPAERFRSGFVDRLLDLKLLEMRVLDGVICILLAATRWRREEARSARLKVEGPG